MLSSAIFLLAGAQSAETFSHGSISSIDDLTVALGETEETPQVTVTGLVNHGGSADEVEVTALSSDTSVAVAEIVNKILDDFLEVRVTFNVEITGVSSGSATITVTATENYGVGEAVSETFTVTVTPAQPGAGLTATPASLTITEGSSGNFTLALAAAPTGTVTVALSSDNDEVAASPASLTFTTSDWSLAQTVTVDAAHDDDAANDSATLDLDPSGGGYDDVADESVTVTVDDDETASLAVAGGPVALTEGGSAGTFTVALSHVPTAAVTVAVASGDAGAAAATPTTLSFTPTNWNAAQTVTVTPVDDADAGNEALSVSLAASGVEYDEVAGSVSVTVADDETASLAVAGGPVSLTEGGSAGTFTVALSHVPTAAVTVAVSSGDTGAAAATPTTLSFTPTNWNTAQTVTVTPVDDADAGDEALSVSLTASGATEYGSVTGSVSVTVADDETASLAVAGGPVSLTEGGSAGSFTVALSHAPTAAVTVAVSSGDTGAAAATPTTLSFTPTNWNAAQTVTVTPVDDADAGNESLSVSLAASGVEYDEVAGSVAVTVDDDETASLAVAGGPVSLTEGGSVGTFTVALSHVPTAAVTVAVSSGDTGAAAATPTTLSFTPTNWNTAQTVTVTPVDDADAGDEALSVSLTASGATEYGSVTGSVSVTVADDETASLAVAGGPVALTEGGSAGSFTVALSHVPTAAVTVAVSSGDTGAAAATPATLSFTPTNWNVAQTVTVTPVDDADAGNESLSVSLAASGVEYDEVAGSVAVTVADDETASLAVAGGPVALTEGGSVGTFTVALSHVPTAAVTVAVSSGDTGAAAATPTTLSFTPTNWNVAQTVTVTPVNDADAGNESLSVSLAASGVEYDEVAGSVSVTVADDETASLAVAGGPVSLTEGGSAGTFTVALSHVPTAAVTVAVASGDTGAAAATPTTLSFTPTNWNAAQTVTVTPVDDADAGDEALSVSLTASGAAEYGSVTDGVAVTVDDDETASLAVAGGPVSLTEGGSAGSFTVALSHVPTAAVTVAVSSGDTGAAAATPTTLSFTPTNWNVAQTVTVTPVDDADAGDEALSVSLTASGAAEYGSVTDGVAVTVDDDETASLAVAGGPVALTEGGSAGSFTVALSHVPTAAVTVAVASGDTGAAAATPTTLSFTPTNWNTAQTVTVTPVDDADAGNESLSVSLAASGVEYDEAAGSVSVTVADDETASLAVAGGPVSLTEGGSAGTFTVALSHVPTAAVTVAVSSGDAGAAAATPTTLSFTPTNWNTAQTVTVTPVDDADAGNESLSVSLAASGVEYDEVAGSVSVTVADDETASLAVAGGPVSLTEGGSAGTFTVALSHVPTAAVTVAVSSGDTGAAAATPTTLSFTPTNWNAAQTVTVTPVDDADAGNEALSVSLTASGAAEYGSVTGGVSVTVDDDETASLAVAGGPVALTEGGSAGTFTVALSHVPTAAVTVAVSSGDAGAATATPTTLSFTPTNWNTAQTVTVTPVDDADAGNEALSVSLAASGVEYDEVAGSVSVTVADDETASLAVAGGPVALTEGGSAGTFTVALSHVPTAAVTVAVASGDTGAAAATPTTLSFTPTNWNTAQTVTVTPVDDADAGNEALSVSLAASGVEYDEVAGSVSVTVADDETASLAVAGGPVSLTEGGSAGTFTVALSHVPTAAVTVAVASGDAGAAAATPTTLSFTPTNWNAAQTVTVTPVDDADAGDEALSVSLTASGATEYGSVTGSVSVTVADDETASLAVAGGPVALTEGGSAGTFTVALSHVPTAAVTVAVASGDTGAAAATPATLSFTPTNWNAAQTVTVTPVDDADAGNEALSVSLAASGVEYDEVAGSVSVTVADDETASLAVAGGPVSLTEGGSAGTFTVALSHVPTAAVTVAVASGDAGAAAATPTTLSFTPTNWNAAQTVTVTPVDDADAGNEALSVSLAASGVEYDEVAGSVSVTVADDETASLAVAGGPVSLTEGGSAGTFTVALSHVPTAAVTVAVASGDTGAAAATPTTLSFTPTNWNAAQTVTVTPVDDADAGNEALSVSLAASGVEYDEVAGSVSVTVADDETASLAVAGGPVSLTEGGSAGTFTVALSHVPTAAVTVAVASGDAGAAAATPTTLSFTPTNWNAAQTVTVTPVDDADAGNEALSVSLAASGVEYDEVAGSVSVTVDDDETASLAVAGGPVALTEGGSAGTFTVALSHVPTAAVTVAVASGDAGAAAATPTTLSFTPTNWNAAQTVTVTPVDDADAGNESLSVSLAASGVEYDEVAGSVSVTVADDETASLAVAGGPVALTEGGSAGTFTVALSHVPTAAVTVAVASGDTGAAAATPTTLSFTPTNWNAAQTVTVTPVDDADAGNEALSVSLAASGVEYDEVAGSVSVTVADDETASLAVAGGPVSLTEGGSAGTFTVALSHVPTAAVTVAVASGDTGAAAATPATLSFTPTNWNAAQTVTVTPVDDADAGNEALSVSLAASGVEYDEVAGSVSVTVDDDETASLAVAGGPVALTEGGSAGTFTVALSHAPTAAVTVAVASGDAGAAAATPTTLSFTPTNWNTAQTVTVTPVDDADAGNESLSVSLTASGATEYGSVTGSVSVTVADDETASLAVAGGPVSLTEGGSAGTFTVALSHVPTAAVTVAVASGDTGAAAATPATLSFTPTNWNAAQTVTVTPVDDADAGNEALSVSLTASGATEYGSVTGSVSVTVADDETASLAVAGGPVSLTEGGSAGTFTVALSHVPTAAVTVAVASGDAGAAAAAPATLSFTPTNWNTAQTVTVTPVDDADAGNEALSVSLAASGVEYDEVAGSVSVTVADDETASLAVAGGPVSLTEGGSAGTFTVALSHVPTAAVTVAVASGDAGAAAATPTTLSFTPTNWNVAQTVTVTPVDDADAGNEALSVSLAASGVEYDEAAGSVSVTVADDEIASLSLAGLTNGALALSEGQGAGTFTVALSHVPTAAVTVAVSSGDAGAATVSPAELTFTADDWEMAQTVTVSPVDDDGDDAANETVTVALAASGVEYDEVAGSVTVTVADDDRILVLTELDSGEVEENGTFTDKATLAGADAPVNWELGGADAGKFALSGESATEATVTLAEQDFENPADSDGDNRYEYTLKATDRDGDTVTSDVFTVTVTDAKEVAALAVAGVADASVAENAVYSGAAVMAGEAPIGSVAWKLDGDDGELFELSDESNSGVTVTLTVRDFENPTDADADNSYIYTLTATDDDENTVSRTVTVTVTDAIETATLTLAGVADASVAEGAAYSRTATLTGGPIGAVSWSLSGADADLFTLSGASNGGVTVSMTPKDFENPSDADGGNSYAYTLTATDDDSNTTNASVTIAVTDADETAALAIAGVGDASVAENAGYSGMATLTGDAPIGAVAWSLSGADAGLFALSGGSNSGVTVSMAARNYENPGDSDADNGYAYTLTATDDDDNITSLAVTVTVTDVIEAAALALGGVANASVAENADYAGAAVLTGDAPIGAVAWSLSGADADLFALSGASNSGVTVTLAGRDFEKPDDSDADNGYAYTLTATDADGNMADRSVTVTVTNEIEDAPPEVERQVLKAMLARIARTALSSATDAIRLRFDATPGAPALSLAGRRVGDARQLAASETGNRIVRTPGGAAGRHDAVSAETLLGGSAFTLPLAASDETADSGAAWTVWGRGDWRQFEGPAETGRYEGEQRAGWLGLDARLDERLLAGLGLSMSDGETDYRIDEDSGSVETSVTAVWPYLQMTTEGGGRLRLVLGAGQGEMEHRPREGAVERADLELLALSAGGRMPVAQHDRFALSATGELGLAQIETDGSRATSIGGLKAASWRLGVGVEAEHDGFVFSSSELTLAPHGALTLRQDGGDGVTGSGVEVSVGGRLTDPGSRFSLDASGRWLAAHSGRGVREWGASLEARLAPGARGRGLSWSVRLTTGPRADRSAMLADDLDYDEASFGSNDATLLELEARYGFQLPASSGLLSPLLRLSEETGDRSKLEAGLAFQAAARHIDLELIAGHENRGGSADNRRLHFNFRFNF